MITIRHVPLSHPPAFQVAVEGSLAEARSGVPSPATMPVEGRPASNLLAELQWYLEHFLDYPFEPESGHAARVQGALRKWGKAAFNALFSEEQGRFVLIQERDPGRNRILLISDDPAIHSWPWEAMRAPNGQPLAQSHLVQRQLSAAGASREITSGLPRDRINILMVVARPYDNDVQHRTIARPLTELIESEDLPVEVTILRPPTLTQLTSHLESRPDTYHVIHFDMHGAYGPGAGGKLEGCLVFEGGEGSLENIRASEIGAFLKRCPVPLAVLTACQSAMISAQADPHASVATALLANGVPSVVAMAYNLYVSASQQFLPAFYRTLFQTGDVSRAVFAGRLRMLEEPGRVCSRGRFPLEDWLVPVLYEQKPHTLDFASARANLQRPVSNLPPELLSFDSKGFVGREAAMLALERAMLRPEAAIVIQGMAGMGKTVLAKGLLRWLEATGGLGVGVFWISFQEVHSALYVLNRIGEPLLGESFSSLPLPAQISAVSQVLKQHQIVMVWDNFESVTTNLSDSDMQVLASFIRALSGGATKILITSRTTEDWLGKRVILPLTGLRHEERWEFCDLQIQRLGISVNRNDPKFAELIDRLQGHPLSMRIALARLSASSPQRLLADLERNVSLLDNSSDAMEAQLEAAFAFVDGAVPEDLRVFLAPLSFFSQYAPFDLIAIVASSLGIADALNKANALAGLLIVHGLMQPLLARSGAIQNYYELHPLLSARLKARFSSPERRSEIERWAAPFVDQVARFVDSLWSQPLAGQQVAYEFLGSAVENALELALRYHIDVAAAAMMQFLGFFALNQGRLQPAADRFKQLLEFSHARHDHPTVATACFQLATIAQRNRDFDRALEYHKQSLEAKRAAGLNGRIAVSLFQLASLYGHMGDEMKARDHLNQAYEMSLQLNQKEPASMALLGLGALAEKQDDLAQAESHYNRALELAKKSDAKQAQAEVYAHLASIAARSRRLREAEGHLINARAIRSSRGEELECAYLDVRMAELRAISADFRRSKDLYLRALEVYERRNDMSSAARAYSGLAELAVAAQDAVLAEQWLQRACSVDKEEGLQPYFRVIQSTLSSNPAIASHLASTALRISNEVAKPFDRSMAEQFLGIAAEAIGRFDEAVRWYSASLATRTQIGEPGGIAAAQSQLAGGLEGQGNRLESARMYVASCANYRRIGDFPSAQQMLHLANDLIKNASLEEATEIQAILKSSAGL